MSEEIRPFKGCRVVHYIYDDIRILNVINVNFPKDTCKVYKIYPWMGKFTEMNVRDKKDFDVLKLSNYWIEKKDVIVIYSSKLLKIPKKRIRKITPFNYEFGRIHNIKKIYSNYTYIHKKKDYTIKVTNKWVGYDLNSTLLKALIHLQKLEKTEIHATTLATLKENFRKLSKKFHEIKSIKEGDIESIINLIYGDPILLYGTFLSTNAKTEKTTFSIDNPLTKEYIEINLSSINEKIESLQTSKKNLYRFRIEILGPPLYIEESEILIRDLELIYDPKKIDTTLCLMQNAFGSDELFDKVVRLLKLIPKKNCYGTFINIKYLDLMQLGDIFEIGEAFQLSERLQKPNT